MRDQSQVRIEQAMIALMKAEMDDKLMTLEAIEAAKMCYSQRYISEMRMTSYGDNDKGADVINQVVGQYNRAKKESGF